MRNFMKVHLEDDTYLNYIVEKISGEHVSRVSISVQVYDESIYKPLIEDLKFKMNGIGFSYISSEEDKDMTLGRFYSEAHKRESILFDRRFGYYSVNLVAIP